MNTKFKKTALMIMQIFTSTARNLSQKKKSKNYRTKNASLTFVTITLRNALLCLP